MFHLWLQLCDCAIAVFVSGLWPDWRRRARIENVNTQILSCTKLAKHIHFPRKQEKKLETEPKGHGRWSQLRPFMPQGIFLEGGVLSTMITTGWLTIFSNTLLSQKTGMISLRNVNIFLFSFEAAFPPSPGKKTCHFFSLVRQKLWNYMVSCRLWPSLLIWSGTGFSFFWITEMVPARSHSSRNASDHGEASWELYRGKACAKEKLSGGNFSPFSFCTQEAFRHKMNASGNEISQTFHATAVLSFVWSVAWEGNRALTETVSSTNSVTMRMQKFSLHSPKIQKMRHGHETSWNVCTNKSCCELYNLAPVHLQGTCKVLQNVKYLPLQATAGKLPTCVNPA